MKELLDTIFPTLSDELIIVISLIIELLITASLIPVSYTHLKTMRPISFWRLWKPPIFPQCFVGFPNVRPSLLPVRKLLTHSGNNWM